MMLLVLILANIYVLYSILPSLIENSIFRIPNDNLSKFVDRASVLKRYDMQILINDILIFDQILGYVAANPSTQSTYDPETTSPQLLMKSYLIPQTGPTQNDTMYYVRPKSTLSASGETAYYQFSKDFYYWKLLAYFYKIYYSKYFLKWIIILLHCFFVIFPLMSYKNAYRWAIDRHEQVLHLYRIWVERFNVPISSLQFN